MKRKSPTSSHVLSKHIEKKENNLNAIRLLLALTVLFSHSYPLALGMEIAKLKFQGALGVVAVDLFFFISGLLITASWLRSKSMNDYLRKRALRIYPGFVASLLFTTVIMTTVNPSGLLSKVVSWAGVKTFVYGCVSLSSLSLCGPEVFPLNPFPENANSSLWTIPIEFECYLGICLIGLFCLFKFRWLILAAFIYNYLLVCKSAFMGWDFSHQDRRFLTYFLAGMCAWLWRDKILLHWSMVLGSFALIALSIFTRLHWAIIEPLALTYIILWLGYAKPLKVTRWCDTTDLSYGVYLYAFPIQQLIATTIWGRNLWVMLVLAIPITMATALISWHLIEKRFLSLKSSRFVDRDPALPAEPAAKEMQLNQAF